MSVRVVEELEVFTPLGIRFWDPVLARVVGDGLKVCAYPRSAPRQVREAFRTRSHLYSFRWLSGMRPVEHRERDPAFFDASPPGQRRFVVAVEDRAGRFVPVAFDVSLPLAYRGVFLSDAAAMGGAQDAPPGVYLFSTPTRPTGERLTAVRGTLVDADSGARAAFALVRVAASHGAVFHGLADEHGRFSVLFPFPSLEEGFASSPPNLGQGTPLRERGWDVTVSVFYEPGALEALPGTKLPEYRSILGQRRGSLWTDADGPSALSMDARTLRLSFGDELVMRSGGLSAQLVSPAPTSP